MIAERRNLLAIGLILALTHTSAVGSEPNQPAIELEFREDGGWRKVTFEEPPPIPPSHAAYFIVQWRFEPTSEPNAADLLSTPTGKSFSTLQRELLKLEKHLWLKSQISKTYMSDHDMPFGSTRYTAYAVGEEDAKKMGRAALEFLIRKEKDGARRMKKDHLERLLAMQSELRETVAKAKEDLEVKQEEVSIADQKYEDAIRNSSYSLHPTSRVAGEVLKTMSEMDKMLDLLNIEIVGIQSKLSAIKEYSDQNDVMGHETLRYAVREMAIRQEVELVGAESRRQATMTVKNREEALYHLFHTLCDLEQEVRNLEGEIREAHKQIELLDRDIDHIGPGELTFYIDGGKAREKVAIQRVRVKVQAKESYPLYRD